MVLLYHILSFQLKFIVFQMFNNLILILKGINVLYNDLYKRSNLESLIFLEYYYKLFINNIM